MSNGLKFMVQLLSNQSYPHLVVMPVICMYACPTVQMSMYTEYERGQAMSMEVIFKMEGMRQGQRLSLLFGHAVLHNDVFLFISDDPMVCSISNPDFVIYSSVVSFYLPFIVTLLVYIRIYVFLRMRRKRIAFGQASGKIQPGSTPPSVVSPLS